MAAVDSTFKDPSVNFVWWIEGDKIAIATSEGDGGTTETGNGRLKAPIIGSGSDLITNGMLISYYAEPDKLSSITGTIDLDNALQPALILLFMYLWWRERRKRNESNINRRRISGVYPKH